MSDYVHKQKRNYILMSIGILVVALIGGIILYIFFIYIPHRANQNTESNSQNNQVGFDSLDSDDDGLRDFEELHYGTDINKKDTDGDGFSDGEEEDNGYNPFGDGMLVHEGSEISDKTILELLQNRDRVTLYHTNITEVVQQVPDTTEQASSEERTKYMLWVKPDKTRLDVVSPSRLTGRITLQTYGQKRSFLHRVDDEGNETFERINTHYTAPTPIELSQEVRNASTRDFIDVETLDNKPVMMIEYKLLTSQESVFRAWVWTTTGLVLKKEELDLKTNQEKYSIQYADVFVGDFDDGVFSIPR